MNTDIFPQIIVLGIINFLIAHFLGKKRQIGFWWSFILGFFLIPIFSIFVVLSSKKNTENYYQPTKSNENWGWFLIIIGLLSLIGSYMAIQDRVSTSTTGMTLAFGLILLGFYLFDLEKRKRAFMLKNEKENI